MCSDSGRRNSRLRGLQKLGFTPLGAQKLYENGGINITKEKADKWNTRLQHHEFQVLANNTAKTASLDAVGAFVDAQAQTAITCW